MVSLQNLAHSLSLLRNSCIDRSQKFTKNCFRFTRFALSGLSTIWIKNIRWEWKSKYILFQAHRATFHQSVYPLGIHYYFSWFCNGFPERILFSISWKLLRLQHFSIAIETNRSKINISMLHLRPTAWKLLNDSSHIYFINIHHFAML